MTNTDKPVAGEPLGAPPVPDGDPELQRWADASEGGVTEADRESFADDPALGIVSEQIGEVHGARERVLRQRTILLVAGWVVACFFAVAYYRVSSQMMKFRFPYVLAQGGTVRLVNALPDPEGDRGSYDRWVPEAVLRDFVERYYSASRSHSRDVWPGLDAFWLRPQDRQKFAAYSQAALSECLKAGTRRKVVPRVVYVRRSQPIPGGGPGRVLDGEAEFDIEERGEISDELIRSQRYRLNVRFTLGTPFGTDKEAEITLWGQNNPMHFTLVDSFEAVPMGMDRSGDPLPIGRSGSGVTLAPGVSPAVPTTANPAQPVVPGIR